MGYKKEHGGQFHVVVTATLTMLAKAVVVAPRRGGKRGRKRKWYLDMWICTVLSRSACAVQGDTHLAEPDRTVQTLQRPKWMDICAGNKVGIHR